LLLNSVGFCIYPLNVDIKPLSLNNAIGAKNSFLSTNRRQPADHQIQPSGARFHRIQASLAGNTILRQLAGLDHTILVEVFDYFGHFAAPKRNCTAPA
jgi:hypothetical protein